MPLPDNASNIASQLLDAASTNKSGSKRLKVRTLMKRFGFKRRTEENTAEITELLKKTGLLVYPSIMKLGDGWELTIEDWVVLSTATAVDPDPGADSGTEDSLPADWNSDGWFDALPEKRLRTEKEVETKFVIPLLARLGFSEDERYDDMPVPAAHGARQTTLKADFALFNLSYESLRNQVLLTVEAKRKERLTKPVEIRKAMNQAKSYSLWTGCYFCLITDSKRIELYKLARSHAEQDRLLFSCERSELKDRFTDLYRVASKDSLTQYYLQKYQVADELL